MEETTEQDLRAPQQGPIHCEALIVLARWALEMFELGQMELFPWGSEELAQFLRAIRSLNCSFVLRAGTYEAHVSDQSENPPIWPALEVAFVQLRLIFFCNINGGENATFLTGRQESRRRDAVLVCRCCWKVCRNCQKAWVIFFSDISASFCQIQSMLSALQPTGSNSEKMNSLGSLRRACYT